jgi:acylglycerol lipase
MRLLLVLMVTACAPIIAPAGQLVTKPHLDGTRFIAADGAALPMRCWLPAHGEKPKAIILALHGFNDYSNFFDDAGRWFADRDIASYAYDQRGFGKAPNRGLWAGTAALTSDLREVTGTLRQRYPATPLYLLGESMGGAVILVTMGGAAPADVDGVILAAPAVWGRDSMPWYQSLALWMAAHSLPDRRVTGGGLGIRPSDNTKMLMALGRDPLVIKETRIDAVFGLVNLMDQAMAAAPNIDVPTLILYGENDQLVPPAAMAEMLSTLPPAPLEDRRFALYADGYHMLLRDLDAKIVWRDIASWIAAKSAPLPSGADRHATEACSDTKLCVNVPS